MKFFVTGGAGYIGSTFVNLACTHGHECLVFDNLEYGRKENVDPRAIFVIGDIRQIEDIKNAVIGFDPDVVFHFAAYTSVHESMQNPESYFKNNFIGTLNVLNAAGQRPFIFSSSCAAMDFKASPYGNSKFLAETVISSYSKLFGFPAIALRYFNVYGGGYLNNLGPEFRLIPKIISAAASDSPVDVCGNDYPTSDGTCVREYIHVKDVASANLCAANYLLNKRDFGFERIDITSHEPLSVIDVINSFEKILDKKIDIQFKPRRPGDSEESLSKCRKAETILRFLPAYLEFKLIYL